MVWLVIGLDARCGGTGILSRAQEIVCERQGDDGGQSKHEKRIELALFVVGVVGTHGAGWPHNGDLLF